MRIKAQRVFLKLGENQVAHGGSRAGAGRPAKWKSTSQTSVWIPEQYKALILDYARLLDQYGADAVIKPSVAKFAQKGFKRKS